MLQTCDVSIKRKYSVVSNFIAQNIVKVKRIAANGFDQLQELILKVAELFPNWDTNWRLSRCSCRSKRTASSSLKPNWENALAAGGRICVVTDNMATLRRIQGSITQWSVFERCRVALCIICLVTLKDKTLGDSPCMWLRITLRILPCQKGRFLGKNPAEFAHILLILVINMYFICQKARNLCQ